MIRTFAKHSLLFFAIACFALPDPAFAKKKKENIDKGNTIENLFRPSRMRNLLMSPDGKYIAGLAPMNKSDSAIGLVIQDLDTMEIVKSFAWRPDHDIYGHVWLDNDSVAFQVSKWDYFAHGLYRIDVNRSKSAKLIGSDAVVRIIDPMEEDSSSSWLWVRAANEYKSGLVKLKKNGRKGTDRIKDNPLVSGKINDPIGDVYRWYIDHASVPRIVIRFNPKDDKLEYLLLSENQKKWTPLELDPEDWDIHLFHHDNKQVYISGYNGEDTKGFYLYDLESGAFSELLFRDDYYDFSETARFMTFQDKLVGIQYDKDVPAMVWFSDDLVAIQKMIDGTLPDRFNIIYDWSVDLSRLLIYSYSDASPPEYLFLDLKNKALKEISKSAPWLDYNELSKTEVIHFKTKDGLRLEGYLTRPTTGQAPYPTIALVHGGPWARDYGTYDEEAQFLASRGYAVLKVNYRGSTGYGKKISFEPEYDFRAMHEDITEAVQSAVKSGIADPNRLAIMGASFGGYAAICGAAFEPDLYQCAITNMGVFDWEEMIKSRKQQRSRYSHHKLLEELGDPKDSAENFDKISPILHVDKIKIPIYIIHGKKDSNVSIRQSKRLKSELNKHNAEFETLFVGGEGHNIFDWKNRIKTYESIVEFLDKHMQ